MNLKKTSSILLLFAMFGMNFLNAADWQLIDNFQSFSANDIYLDATDIGWNATIPEDVDEYWMFEDPYDPDNIALYVECGSYGVGYTTVWFMKELPGGGIQPGETGTLFFRCLWSELDHNWNMATADKPLAFDEETGLQTAPGAWRDLNALVRLGPSNELQHRDGDSYVATDPEVIPETQVWYDFWMVVENSWDMTTSPPTCTGTHSLYMRGEGIGNGESPTLIPVGTDPSRNGAALRRAPVDDYRNPQAIIWAVFTKNSGAPGNPSSGDICLLDDFYFSSGENLTHPLLGDLPGQLAKPTDLKAIILPESGIQLTWQDNSNAETGYKIQVKIGDAVTWEELADIPEANATSFLVEDLDTDQTIRFGVQAYSETLESGYSNTTAASWGNPVFQGATFGYSGWWDLDWFGSYRENGPNWIYHDELGLIYVEGEDASSILMYSYLLESWLWTSSGVFPWFYKYGPYAGWYYYYEGPSRGGPWFARYSDGTFVRASFINQAVPQPGAPSNLIARINVPNTVYLHWEDNADYEVGYRIFMMAGEDEEWSELATLPIKNLTYHHLEGIDTSAPLRFRIQAYKYGSDSDFSNVALAEVNSAGPESWLLIDDFQAYSSDQIFTDATEIGWNACAPDQTDEYWMLEDPLDPDNIAMYVEPGNYGVGYGNTWVMKALPDGGILPGETGTLFFRSFWDSYSNDWHMATADKPLAFDEVTGLQITPGAWGDLNALIRIADSRAIEHRDGGAYVATSPRQVPAFNAWYSFWMVVENSWDMTTTPPTSTGTHTLYVQGEGIGDGVSPTLIPVGTDPPKGSAFLRRAPVDDDGNPRAIIWAVFATHNGGHVPSGSGGLFLLDDFYFSEGVNVSVPQ